MASKFPEKGQNPYVVSMLEKRLIEKNYDCFTCRVDRGGYLKAKGKITPTEYSATYDFIINYMPYSPPKVYIIKPKIEFDNDIHMYKNGNLCLYYPGDMRWNSSLHIYNTIVPWTAEWLIFYELYKISGEWEHPYVPHGELKTE